MEVLAGPAHNRVEATSRCGKLLLCSRLRQCPGRTSLLLEVPVLMSPARPNEQLKKGHDTAKLPPLCTCIWMPVDCLNTVPRHSRQAPVCWVDSSRTHSQVTPRRSSPYSRCPITSLVMRLAASVISKLGWRDMCSATVLVRSSTRGTVCMALATTAVCAQQNEPTATVQKHKGAVDCGVTGVYTPSKLLCAVLVTSARPHDS